jgi:hypothetical protein
MPVRRFARFKIGDPSYTIAQSKPVATDDSVA